MGLAEGSVLKRDVTRDECITFDDVARPEGRRADALWAEQAALFATECVAAAEQTKLQGAGD